MSRQSYILDLNHRCAVMFKFFWGRYMGLWENLGGGPLFPCFIAFLWYNFSKSFKGVHEVPPPPSPCVDHWLKFDSLLSKVQRYLLYGGWCHYQGLRQWEQVLHLREPRSGLGQASWVRLEGRDDPDQISLNHFSSPEICSSLFSTIYIEWWIIIS